MSKPADSVLPDKMEIHHYNDYIHITHKWFSLQTLFLTVFAIIWDSIIVIAYSNMGAETGLVEKLFPLVHVAIGMGITYYTIASWLNKTSIYVSKDALEIRHKPIPWLGNKRLLVSDIKQFYAKEKTSYRRKGAAQRHAVHVISNNGKDTQLISALETREQALFIEQEIENYLGIENKKVPGEVTRT